jgi:uncharacterized protein (DUF1778 family)
MPNKGKSLVPKRERSKQLNIRLSETEIELLQKKVKKSKLSQSEFIRKSILEKNIIVIDEIKGLMVELKRVGNNLNQVTRMMNNGEVKDSKELAQVKNNLENVWNQVINALKKVNE